MGAGAVMVCLAVLLAPQEDRLVGGGLSITWPPGKRGLAIEFLNAWPAARIRVETLVGGRLPEDLRLEIVGDLEALQARVRALTGHEPAGWVGGVALTEHGLMVIRSDLPASRQERVEGILTHEASHLALAARLREAGAARAPRWFDEGVAQLAEGRLLVETAPDLPMRAFFGKLLDLAELETAFPEAEGASALAYAQAESFVGWLSRLPEIDGVRPMVDGLAAGQTLDGTLRTLTQLSLAELERRWRKDLRADKSWVPGFAGEVGFALLILVGVVVVLPRRLRRRKRLRERWEAEERAEAAGEPPPPSRAQPLPRHRGWIGARRLRRGDDEPEV